MLLYDRLASRDMRERQIPNPRVQMDRAGNPGVDVGCNLANRSNFRRDLQSVMAGF
jgi:hypothetical protein